MNRQKIYSDLALIAELMAIQAASGKALQAFRTAHPEIVGDSNMQLVVLDVEQHVQESVSELCDARSALRDDLAHIDRSEVAAHQRQRDLQKAAYRARHGADFGGIDMGGGSAVRFS